MEIGTRSIEVREHETKWAFDAIFLSCQEIGYNCECTIVAGCTGNPTKSTKLKVGDVLTYETGDKGTFEVRLIRVDQWTNDVGLLIAKLK